jgi:hypothetical protein
VAKREADGESLVLDEKLWPAAAAEQEKRRIKDPWEEQLTDIPKNVDVYQHGSKVPDTIKVIHNVANKEFVSSADVLTYVLKVPIDRQDRHHSMRLADTMKRLGWERERASIDDSQRRGFARLVNQPGLFANLANPPS